MGNESNKALGAFMNLTEYSKLPIRERIIYSLLRPDDSRKNDSTFNFPDTFLGKGAIEPTHFFTLSVSSDSPPGHTRILTVNTEITCDLLWALLFNQVRFPTSYKGSQKDRTLEERVMEILQLAAQAQRQIQIFRPITEDVVKSKIEQPSSFAYILDNYRSFPFSILKPLLEQAKDDPLLPKVKIIPYKNFKDFEDEVQAKKNDKPSTFLNGIETQPLFRAIDISLAGYLVQDSFSLSSNHPISQYSGLFDLLLDYPFEGTTLSDIEKGHNILHCLAGAHHRNRHLITNIREEKNQKKMLQTKCHEMLTSFISSGKLVKEVMINQRLPSTNQTPFEYAALQASADFLNEMIGAKLFIDSDFENALLVTLNPERTLYFDVKKVSAVLSLPVENRIERARNVVKEHPMKLPREVVDLLYANGIM